MPEIMANDTLRKRICNGILTGSLSHAYVIEGSAGSGKHTIAMMTAAAVSCLNRDKDGFPLPCLECASCRKILGFKSPDVITVGSEGKATVGVDTVRFIREDVCIVPNELDCKTYIIEDADKMTVQAQNAFLLTLEEPPSYAMFILLCENSGALLETIRSRAPVLRTEPVPTELIDSYITSHDRRAAQMKASEPLLYAELLTCASNGIGRALSLLDRKNFTPVLEKRALATDFLSAAINRRRSEDILAVLGRFSSKREDVALELSYIYSALRDLIVLKKNESVPLCFFCDRDAAIDLCDRTSASSLFRLSEAVSTASSEISRNANVRLTLTKLAASTEIL